MNGYFDYNATTPLHPAARAAWLEAADRFWQNPSGLFREAGAARQKLEDCREQIADWLGCGAEEIVFLSGATEANNAVMVHVAAGSESRPGAGSRPEAGPVKTAISAIEHPCVQEPARRAFGAAGSLIEIPVTPAGVTDLVALEEILTTHRPALVSVMAANNETGVLQPWREVLALCREFGALFHCDAAQWVGKKPSAGLGDCDFLTVSAHKFGGPKGIGFLKVPEGGRPLRWLSGGPQEERRRAGTENLPGVAAMTAAWGAVEESLAAREAGWLADRAAFETEILTVFPEAEIIGAEVPRLWNTVLLTVPPPVNVKWLTRLSARGFSVSTGSACSRGAGASTVLQAMGVPGEFSGQVLRVSGGWDTTAADWSALAAAMKEVQAGMTDPPRRI